jgi:hypothetical protein
MRPNIFAMARASSARRVAVPLPLPELVQVWTAMEVSAFGAVHVATLPAPCPTGSTVVVGLIDDPARHYTCVDDEGNVYTAVYNSTTTAYDKRGVWFVCQNVVGNPQSITVRTWWEAEHTTPANTALRLYTLCWRNLTATIGGTPQALELAAATGATGTVTTPVDNCVLLMLVNTSPSRTPAIVAPSTLYRMNFQSGTPYAGSLSQHAAFRLCGPAGVHTVQTTWPDGATTARAFVLALRPPA